MRGMLVSIPKVIRLFLKQAVPLGGFLLLSLCCMASGSVASRSFEAQGRLLWYDASVPSKPGQPYQTVAFHVWVDGCRWLIQVERIVPGSRDSVVTYGSDGSGDLYMTMKVPPEAVRPNPGESTNTLEWKRMLKAAERGEVADPAEVWPNRPYPFFPALYGTTFLWLMFCSGCTIPKTVLTTNLPFCFFMDGTAHLRLSLKSELRRHPKDPFLITELKAYNPGYSVDPKGKRYENPPPFNKPWVFFHYRALEFSHWKGIYVPKRFLCEWYTYKRAKSSTNHVVGTNSPLVRVKWRWFEGITEELRPLSHPITGRPPLDGFFAVTDHRAEKMTGGKPIEYLVKNGEWWQTNEPRFLKALKTPGELILAEHKTTPSPKHYRGVLLAVILFSGLLYAFFAWYKAKQRSQQQGGSREE